MTPRPSTKLLSENGKNSRSGIAETFNPVQGANDVGIAPEIIVACRNTENVTAALVSDGAPDASCKKSELIFRRLFARSAGPPVE